MAYSLARLEAEELKAKPVISMGLIGFDNSKSQEFSVDVLVRNNSDEEIVLLPNQVTTYGTQAYHGKIIKSSFGQAHIIILKPNEVGWLTIVFDKPDNERGAGTFGITNLIKFAALSPSGENETISAYIRSDGEIVDISTIE